MTRIAIIGAGPRAAQALDSLERVGLAHGVVRPDTNVIAPGDAVGAGEIYAAGQPDWLRLNVTSSVIDAWSDGAADGPSFDTWRDARSPGTPLEPFPPRALAGRYLAEAGSIVRRNVPGRRISGLVVAVRPSAHGWCIELAGGDLLGGYDEILLATGHASDWDGALRHLAGPDVPLVPEVFPVDRLMDRAARLPAGSLVVVRGAALTALDAVLSLARVRDLGDLRIVMASRTGRLMMPKTEVDVLKSVPALDDLEHRATRRVHAGDDVPDVLLDVGARLLGSAGHRDADDLEVAMRGIMSSQPPPDKPAVWLQRQLETATGERAPDAEWALGQAWRLAYPALIQRQRAISPQSPTLNMPDYTYWAMQMERLAFGPPPVNARDLQDLLDAGVVEVAATDNVLGLARRRDAALVVDAVLPPPGVRQIRDRLTAQLLGVGLLEGSRVGRGVVVGDDAASIVGGRAVAGFSVVGRITEDVVIGNDTLNRRLHSHIDRWAYRILGFAEREEKPAHRG